MKYKTISLLYPTGDFINALIEDMSSHGWGLMHTEKPDYQVTKYGYYTFVASDSAPDVEWDWYNTPRIRIKETKENSAKWSCDRGQQATFTK